MIRLHRLILILLAGSIAFSLLGVSHAQQFPESMYQEMRWRMIGPFRGGRTRAVAGVPSQPNLFYIGAVNGGVWKSDDYGRTWTPIFDQEPTQSVGAIAVAPSDPNIIYVASGEGCTALICRSGTEFTNPQTPARRGRISACVTDSRSLRW